MRIAIFDNLANNSYAWAKVLNRLGQPADLILDPLDRSVMSDPRWDDLDLELPTDQLNGAALPRHPLPPWVRYEPGTLLGERPVRFGRARLIARKALAALGVGATNRMALREAGRRGAFMAAERAWVVHTLSEYDCVLAYGTGPAWAALARVPCLAEVWGGDLTLVPFYDTGDWEGHDAVALPGPPRQLFALAKLQRMGYEHSARILLGDPRFLPFAERLGHAGKCVDVPMFIDVEKYRPQPEADLREEILKGAEGPLVFVPARQDWHWKGSDRLLRGFAQAAQRHPEAVLVCAGWGADLDRSRALIGELGIGERVRLLPFAMSKERLRRYYCAADVVADQFTLGSYGTSALEAMSCARPLLISLDRDRFAGRLSSFPPVMNVAEPAEIASALARLFDDPKLRSTLGAEARSWVAANHGTQVAERVIELCRVVVAEGADQLHTVTR
jgi:glycosyltransferase involved in cell wall biosynthesis